MPNQTTSKLAEDPAQGKTPPHAETAEQVAARLGANLIAGWRAEDVASLRQTHGSNELSEAAPTPLWRKFLAQFNALVIWILMAAAIVSAAVREWVDALAILAIVLVNGVIGFLQEYRAERTLASLRKLSGPLAKVVREGAVQSLPAAELVPGDRIEIEAGDNIPADVRLIDTYGFRVQEASLTGESTPVEKDASLVLPAETGLGDRRNLAYVGTLAAAGRAAAIVVATGMQSELGKIAGLLENQLNEPTPLQRRLSELGRVLVYVCLALVSIIFWLELRRGGHWLDVFLVSVSLAVAAVPEGLPVVVTVTLALGLQRMAKRNALVRKLPSVETLGSVTVVCSDKTGTLTRNEMTVQALITGDAEYRVTGSGYAPHGEIQRMGKGSVGKGSEVRVQGSEVPEQGGSAIEPAALPLALHRMLTAAARCNNAKVVSDKANQTVWQVVGDPTEGALIVVARKAGIEATSSDLPLVAELPFDSQRKAMSVVVRQPDGAQMMYSKGAPEVLAPLCVRELVGEEERPLTEDRRQEILEQSARLAGQAYRVLALACRLNPRPEGKEYKEQDLTFLGLAGLIDPPREEAKDAIATCRAAGIRPIMITGDHPATAQAIAGELGILAAGQRVLTGQELDALSAKELARQVDEISVYARVTAEHKLQVVQAWKQRGQVVAMTGDGVNDAPAVKAADIGIAMGIAGTDVTKEASDMVLTDDNFTSIVNAIEEGRGIFDNIQNTVRYLLSCNAGEVIFMFFASLAGWPIPLAAIQILWINLVTDGLPALALAMEPPDHDVMRRPPRPPREGVLTLRRGLGLLLNGGLVAAATAGGYWYAYQGDPERAGHARTVAFCVLAYSQLCLSFACRSDRRTLLELGPFSNPHLLGAIAISALLQLCVIIVPFVRPVFEVSAVPLTEWWLIAALSLAPVTMVEVSKLAWAAVGWLSGVRK